MAINYPGSLDTTTQLPQPSTSNNTNNPSHAGAHDNESAAIIALEGKVGTGASTPTANKVLRATGTGTTTYAQVGLTTDVTGILPTANGGTGTSSVTGSGSLVLATGPTLNTPTITNPSLSGASGVLTLPVGPDTLVGRNTTDTIKNKTLDSTNSVAGAALTNSSVTASKLATGATGSNVATSETTASTSYVGLTTAQAFSVTIGANGLLLVHIGASISGTGGNLCYMSFALSGGNTLASADARSVITNSTVADTFSAGRSFLLTGLSAGSTTVTAQFRVGGGTGTFSKREINAVPL